MTTGKPKEIVLQNNDRIPGVFFTIYLWNIRERTWKITYALDNYKVSFNDKNFKQR